MQLSERDQREFYEAFFAFAARRAVTGCLRTRWARCAVVLAALLTGLGFSVELSDRTGHGAGGAVLVALALALSVFVVGMEMADTHRTHAQPPPKELMRDARLRLEEYSCFTPRMQGLCREIFRAICQGNEAALERAVDDTRNDATLAQWPYLQEFRRVFGV